MVDALKLNGSLHKVSIPGCSSVDLIRIRAFGQRNQRMPKLLAELTVQRKDHEPKAPNDNLIPSFFMSALDAKRTAPTMLLMGLLSASDRLEPNCSDNKRSQ